MQTKFELLHSKGSSEDKLFSLTEGSRTIKGFPAAVPLSQ